LAREAINSAGVCGSGKFIQQLRIHDDFPRFHNPDFFLACGAVLVNDAVGVQDAELNSCKQIFHPFINITPGCFTIDEGSGLKLHTDFDPFLIVGFLVVVGDSVARGELWSVGWRTDGFLETACPLPKWDW